MAHIEEQTPGKNGKASALENLLFGRRALFLTLFIAITLVLGYFMLQLRPEASFLRMIPSYHPFIKNYIDNQVNLKGLGNVVRIAVETEEGSIFSPEYLDVLQKANDEVFFIRGVDRSGLKSLWTPNTRWSEVTMDGYHSDQVIPDTYDGSKDSIELVRTNILKSGEIGSIVANNFKSTMILAPLLDVDMETGQPLDYHRLAKDLEGIRDKFQKGPIKIHIVGFAKLMGDLIDGASRVILFFGIAFLFLLVILYINCRCWKSTSIRALSSLVAVIWQMGVLSLLGYGLNPYSMLVPFLMFALGVSHGIQMFNAMAHEMIYGADKLNAARLAFRTIFRPGLAALVTDCLGFATLMVIRIGVIQDIAIGASIGVAVVAFTDLMLLPILMSYTGISKNTIEIMKQRESGTSHPLWSNVAKFSQKKYARVAIILAVIGLMAGVYMRQGLKTGDLDPGAPELRADSRYNLDNAYINANYGTSSDVFVVMLKGAEAANANYNAVVATDLLKLKLLQTQGVQGVATYVDVLKYLYTASSEGNYKWMTIPRDQKTLDNMTVSVPLTLSSRDGSLSSILIFLEDHKAETLERIVKVTEAFAKENNNEKFKFLLAAGNSGIEAATNIEVEKAQLLMTVLVYAVVLLICMIAYRDWRGSLCVVLPLFLTSVLCEALMAKMGIGIKVATLPVIAVGVGIGVDYGIYIYNKLLHYRSLGHKLTPAYYLTLVTTGRAVSFTGITLSIGVATWAFSPIKFQADMGFLLTFMFLWNMVGAMVLLPALVRFLIKDKPEPELGRV
ncbi:MAG: MMPL family transporter [Desulfobacteraceae bacterium]|nr:MMPL family transporter [Desulfobacteraceae bacterium]